MVCILASTIVPLDVILCVDTNADLRAVLMHIISQLRPGADLSRVVLPTFILEPRSMLERITKYAPGLVVHERRFAIGGC